MKVTLPLKRKLDSVHTVATINKMVGQLSIEDYRRIANIYHELNLRSSVFANMIFEELWKRPMKIVKYE